MKTTTYWYNPGNDVWVAATWTASFTAEPTVATYIPPEGTMVEYSEYLSAINNIVVSSADAAGSSATALTVPWRGLAAWGAMFAGAIGAGALVVGM